MPRLEVRTYIFPTEDASRVLRAVSNVIDLSDAKPIESKDPHENYIVVSWIFDSLRPLEKLQALLRSQRVLDAARTSIERGLWSGGVKFYLNKQAAYMGKASFCSMEFGESPMGAITVIVFLEECDPLRFLDWLAPRTKQGVPVEERDQPC
uniref:UPF0201 protein ENV17_01505 n=1 Tax=Thermofilum pendens TaxID=2269 RepID=A0A7C4FDP2_THEPE